MEIESVDMSQAALEEQAAAQARADREREQQIANTSSNAQTITDPNLGQTVNILD
jgi:hypothetical protein